MNADPGIEAKTVETYLSDIEKGTNGMREALLSRNQAAIMAAVSAQEQLLEEFSGVWDASRQAQVIKKDSIRSTVGRIRGLLRRNTAIAKTFLNLINGTIESLNAKTGHRSCAYDETGRGNHFASAILVNDLG